MTARDRAGGVQIVKLLGGPSRHRIGRLLGAVAVASLVTAGCGGASKADDNQATPAASGEGAAAADTQAGGGSTTSTVPKPRSSSAGSKATTTTTKPGAPAAAKGTEGQAPPPEDDPYKRTLAITAELTETCVRPGGTQTVKVRTLSYAGVAFDTEYSDYLTGMQPGHYGGNSGGFTDAEGTYSFTWVVAPNAPAGKATVLVLGSHDEGGIGETKAFFTVADALGKCA